ncbi:MAG: hypothetical protein H0W02_16735, partial [Ktedonobacteraceae bacterium]|nr:hypothetical protein [Ktedonobacteraceae bacterium]
MGTGPGISRPIITRIITAAICFMLLLFSLPGALAATGVSAQQNSVHKPLLPVDTATTVPTDTPSPTATPTDTPSPTATPTNTPSPTPTRPKPTPTKQPTTVPTVRPTATAAHPTATSTAKGANATATAAAAAAALTPTVTQDTGGGQLPPTSNTPGPRNNNDQNPPSGKPQSGNFAFLPLLAGGAIILAAIVILGFLLLRKYISPEPVPEVNLPPSGARPWTRTRNPESLPGIIDNNDLSPLPAAENGWQNPAFSNMFASSQSGSLPGNAGISTPVPNAGFAFPQNTPMPAHPGFPAPASFAAEGFMPAQMNFPGPGSMPNPPTQFGFPAPDAGFASPQYSLDRPDGTFAPANSGLLPAQQSFSPASSGLTPAQENFAPPQGHGFASPSGSLFAQGSPTTPQQNSALGNGNFLFPSGSLSPETEEFASPSSGFGPPTSGPAPARPMQGQSKLPKEVPDWLLAMENDVRNDPFLAETIKQYTDKGRAAHVEKDDGKGK